jgi:antitoxin CcdA
MAAERRRESDFGLGADAVELLEAVARQERRELAADERGLELPRQGRLLGDRGRLLPDPAPRPARGLPIGSPTVLPSDRAAGLGYALEMEAHKRAINGHILYDREAPRKPTRLSVNSDLVEKARELGVDLAATLEDALALEVHKGQRETWLEENREGIEAYNELVTQHGVFSTGLRGF